MSNNHKCSYCAKKYTRISSYERHFILCKIQHQTVRENKCDLEESTDLPTYKELYNIVQELAVKYNALEDKMCDIHKWVVKKKKKLNVLNWLNTSLTPETMYDAWTKEFVVTEPHIEVLLKDNMLITFMTVLQHNINMMTKERPLIPLICFSEKANQFYTYNEANTWSLMEPDMFSKFLKIIYRKIFNGLCDWHSKNSSKIANDDKLGELYSKTLIKLMDMKMDAASLVVGKIKVALYTFMKTELKQQIEYDYEF